MKSKDKSSKQRFCHVNVTNTIIYLNIILLNLLHNDWKKNLKKLKFGLLRFWSFLFKNLKIPRFLRIHFNGRGNVHDDMTVLNWWTIYLAVLSGIIIPTLVIHIRTCSAVRFSRMSAKSSSHILFRRRALSWLTCPSLETASHAGDRPIRSRTFTSALALHNNRTALQSCICI